MRMILIFFVNLIAMIMTIASLMLLCFIMLQFVGMPLMRYIKETSLLQPLIFFGCLLTAVILHFIVYRKIILPFRKNIDKSF